MAPEAVQLQASWANGQVVVWGGENYQLLQGVNVVSPRSEIIFYDPDQDAYGATQRQTPAPIPRSQHRAVVDQNGKLLVRVMDARESPDTTHKESPITAGEMAKMIDQWAAARASQLADNLGR